MLIQQRIGQGALMKPSSWEEVPRSSTVVRCNGRGVAEWPSEVTVTEHVAPHQTATGGPAADQEVSTSFGWRLGDA